MYALFMVGKDSSPSTLLVSCVFYAGFSAKVVRSLTLFDGVMLYPTWHPVSDFRVSHTLVSMPALDC